MLKIGINPIVVRNNIKYAKYLTQYIAKVELSTDLSFYFTTYIK